MRALWERRGPHVACTAGDLQWRMNRNDLVRPDDIRLWATDDGELRITLDPSLAAGLLDGLDYLEHFPYECTEQTVSRFLPNLFTMQALEAAGVEDSELQQQLDEQLV